MAFCIERWVSKKAEQAQAVVERHYYGWCSTWTTRRELRCVIVVGFAIEVTAPVDPHQDWVAAIPQVGCEHVEEQAVFLGTGWTCKYTELGDLGARITEVSRMEGAIPVRHRMRWHPSERTNWWRGVGNSEEFIYAVFLESNDGAFHCLDQRSVIARFIVLGRCHSSR